MITTWTSNSFQFLFAGYPKKSYKLLMGMSELQRSRLKATFGRESSDLREIKSSSL